MGSVAFPIRSVGSAKVQLYHARIMNHEAFRTKKMRNYCSIVQKAMLVGVGPIQALGSPDMIGLVHD